MTIPDKLHLMNQIVSRNDESIARFIKAQKEAAAPAKETAAT